MAQEVYVIGGVTFTVQSGANGILIAGSPDGGTTLKPLKTASDGTLNVIAGALGLLMAGSPDGGTTLKPLLTNSSGALSILANQQAGTALGGAEMDYREMVARGLAGNLKVLNGSHALNNSGAGSVTVTFVDQNNNAYSTVTNGKTLYIAAIDATVDLGGTSAVPLSQSATITLTDGTNTKYKFIASPGGMRTLTPFISLASATTLTVTASASNLATAVGNVVVSIIGWEE